MIKYPEQPMFGRPRPCSVCGHLNPSGYRLPDDCMFCNGKNGFFTKEQKEEFEKCIKQNS